MRRVALSIGVLAALVVAIPSHAAVAGRGPDPIQETIQDNEEQGPSNVPVMGNIVCSITPYDGASAVPKFYGSGSGGPQATADLALLKAVDDASFQAGCASPSSAPYTLELAYRFQYRAPGGWTDIDPGFACSAQSTSAGDANVAVLAVPGSPQCPSRQIYPEDHPSVGVWHRLQIELTVTLPGGAPAPHIKGWALPWPIERLIAP